MRALVLRILVLVLTLVSILYFQNYVREAGYKWESELSGDGGLSVNTQ